MTQRDKNILKCAGTGAGGAAAGATVYGIISGGVGLALTGTAMGITLGPFIAIGAGAGVLGYGLYWLGKEVGGSKKPPDVDAEAPAADPEAVEAPVPPAAETPTPKPPVTARSRRQKP